MKTYYVHTQGASLAIHGDTPEQAVAENLRIIDTLRCCAGYVLLGVESAIRPNILGGKGGIEVIVRYRMMSRTELGTGYLPAHNLQPPPEQSVIWMEAAL